MPKKIITTVKQGSIFEEKVKDVLEVMGYHVERNVLVNGNQIDLIAQKTDGVSDVSLLVECKDESNPIGVEKIRVLQTIVQAAQSTYPGIRGMFVSLKGFSKEARATGKQFPIQCFSFEELQRMPLNCKPYLERLIKDFDDEFQNTYVNLRGKYIENEQVITYSPLDTFVDKWLKDSSRNHLSILGEYGTGKTTFCRHYAAKLARKYIAEPSSNRIPILINLREYAKVMNIESLITHHLSNIAGIQNASFRIFEWMLEKGLLIVLFDGFDEMAQHIDSDVTLYNFEAIADLAKPKSKTILTCRTEYFRTRRSEKETFRSIDSSNNFDIIYIKTFDDKQITEYLRKRIGTNTDPKKDWKYYWDKITTIFDLHDLAVRPVLLNFIIGHLPDLLGKEDVKASDLYEIAIDKELKRRLRIGTKLIRREDRIKLIQLLSAWMYEYNQFYLREEKIPEILNIKKYFNLNLQRDIEYYINDFLNSSFLSKDSDGNYRFSHKSFVDYFVARKLVEEVGQNYPQNWSKYELSREVTRFIGDMVSKDLKTMNKICAWAFEGNPNLRFNTASAMTCMDSKMVVAYVKKRKEEVVLNNALVWALGEISYKSKEDKEEIIGLLNNIVTTKVNNGWSWWMAAFALKKLDDNSLPVKMLVQNLNKNKKYFYNVKKCFANIEDPRSVIGIIIHAKRFPKVIRNKLIKMVQNYIKGGDYTSWRMGHNLCWLAGELKIRELTNELIEITHKSLNHSTRNIATEALGKIGIAIGDNGYKAVLERLKYTKEIYYRSRFHAAEALGRIGRKEALSELKKALNEEYEPIVRNEIERTIIKLRHPSNIKKS